MRLLALWLLLSGCAHGNERPEPIYACENLADYGCPDTAPVDEEG